MELMIKILIQLICGFLALRRITRQQAARFHLHQVEIILMKILMILMVMMILTVQMVLMVTLIVMFIVTFPPAPQPWPGGFQQPCLCGVRSRLSCQKVTVKLQ